MSSLLLVTVYYCLGYVESDDDEDGGDGSVLFNSKTILEWIKTKDSGPEGRAWLAIYRDNQHETNGARLKLCSVLMAHICRVKGKPSSKVLEKVALKIQMELSEPCVSANLFGASFSNKHLISVF